MATRTRTLGEWQAGDQPDPPDAPDELEVERAYLVHTPAKVSAVLTCPSCGGEATVAATLSSRVVKDSDGTQTLALRTRAPKLAHSCGQLTLDAAATGAHVR